MSYTINLSNSNTLIPGGLPDGTIDGPGSLTKHSSLTLIGRDYPGYGQFLNENFIYLLENFANKTGSSPSNPLKGQLWYNYDLGQMLVWSGTSWKVPAAAQTSPSSSPPGATTNDAVPGDLWFDSTNQQLRVYSGTGGWILVGPPANKIEGDTGAQPSIIPQAYTSTSKICLSFVIRGVTYAIFSTEAFQSNVPGFSSIGAGLNFSTTAGLGLNTQTTAATPNTLVQRDGSGSITAVTVNGTTGSYGGQVSAASFVSTGGGAYTGNVIGNVSIGTTTITGTQITADGITASSGLSGTIQTASQPNITNVGNLVQLRVAGTTSSTRLYGRAYYNDVEIATRGGVSESLWIDNQPIGGNVSNTGTFTTLQVTDVLKPFYAGVIDIGTPTVRWGTIYTGTLSANVLQTGNITAGAVTSNSIVHGTAVTRFGNIGASTNRFGNVFAANVDVDGITLGDTRHTYVVSSLYSMSTNQLSLDGTWRGTGTANGYGPYSGNVKITLAQDINAGAAPNFLGTNFTKIPNAGLLNNSVEVKAGTGLSGGGTVALGGTITLNMAQALGTTDTPTFGALTLTGALSAPSITKTGTNESGDIGQSGNKFNNVYAKQFNGVATQALYADLAERYAADAVYTPGTVVRIGGAAEVTVEDMPYSNDVFGVVSTNPAHLMNSGAGENNTHPPIALTGRVPVRVVGPVTKGDRLVSAGNGCAQAADLSQCSLFNVIGRALEDKLSNEEGLIEAVVSIK